MHSFYIDTPAEGVARLPAEEAKHALKVLRLGPGDEVVALDGEGRWRARIDDVRGGEVRLRLLDALPGNEPPLRLTVYQGLPKADKLDFIAQKLTELGARALIPLRMERSVLKLTPADAEKRRERLERIAREAAKQCGRSRPLQVRAPMEWGNALELMARHEMLLIPWEEARGANMAQAHGEAPDCRDIGIVIGPEGGITPREVDAMLAKGGRCVTLGPRILRTETAAVVSTALAMQLWGDL